MSRTVHERRSVARIKSSQLLANDARKAAKVMLAMPVPVPNKVLNHHDDQVGKYIPNSIYFRFSGERNAL